MLDALREAAASFPDDELTCYRYDRDWGPRERRRRFEAGDRTPLPGSEIIIKHFGCWANALLAAELIDPAAHRRRRFRRGVKMSDAELAECVRQAIGRLGPKLTKDQYLDWREERLTAEDAAEAGLPTSSWLTQRLGHGSWPRAIEAAINWPE